jgi:hypothetical protein
MESNIKLAAERLLKIADTFEKEASENTFFVCDSCNHTASLADINKKRKTASEQHQVKRVASVKVTDVVACVACGGKMAYVPTETSQKYYIEAEDTEDTGVDIFEPVDEQGKDKDEGSDEPTLPPSDEAAPDAVPTDEATPEAAPTEEAAPAEDKAMDMPPEVTPEGEGAPPEKASEEDVAPAEGDTPDEKDPTDLEVPEGGAPPEGNVTPTDEGTPEGDAVMEEVVPGDVADETTEDLPEEKPTKNPKVELPKADVPKFEKMPKDAADAFWKAVQKYSM